MLKFMCSNFNFSATCVSSIYGVSCIQFDEADITAS